ncbi:MAG: response regulator [Pseudomonadota bacterium]|nr:response regulator [Pseudomonadota bacterium]
MTATKRRVYIVDDEPEIRDALTLLLSTAGVDTEEYASAEGFWESAPHGEAFCVILDNRLPGLSGIELLARIVERSRGASVIMMTGHGDIPTAVQAMRLGAFHFVEKPFDAESLLAMVEEALSRAERQSGDHVEAARFRERRATLTEREAEVFDLLLQGCATKTIAAKLDITVRTAEHHRGAVLRKFDARSISALMRLALARND